MSGGFFRGTSADQDTRFSNKQAKLLKSQKFAPELDHLVDTKKVKMEVMKPWIGRRVTELLGFEDEVLINFIYTLLEGKAVNGKEVQIQLTGFMEKNTGRFMKELWTLLLSAQQTASGVPQQFLDAKAEELQKKEADDHRILNKIEKRMDEESKELQLERSKKMDNGVEEKRATNFDMELGSDRTKPKDLNGHSGDDKDIDKRNVTRARSRDLDSRNRRSVSQSRSYSGQRQSRSASRSPASRRRSLSPARKRTHSRRRSRSPLDSRSPSPVPRRVGSYRRKSPSPSWRRRSVSPGRQPRSPSPSRRQRSPSPIRRRRLPSPPRRRRSPSPTKLRRSPSPSRRRRSPSPSRRRRSPSPTRRRRSPSPTRRRRSPSPTRRRRRSPSPSWRRRSPMPSRRRRSRSSSLHDRPVSPVRRHRSPSPVRRQMRSPSPSNLQPRSPSPGHGRSRSPLYSGSRDTPSLARRMPGPLSPRRYPRSPSSRSRSVSPAQRSPVVAQSLQDPQKRSGISFLSSSPSPRKRSSSPPNRKYKFDRYRDFHASHRPSSPWSSTVRDPEDQKHLHHEVSPFSPSPEVSPHQPKGRSLARTRSLSEEGRSSSLNDVHTRQQQKRPVDDGSLTPQKARERNARNSSPDTSKDEAAEYTKKRREYESRSPQKLSTHKPAKNDQKESPVRISNKRERSVERSAGPSRHAGQSEKPSGRTADSASPEGQMSPTLAYNSEERRHESIKPGKKPDEVQRGTDTQQHESETTKTVVQKTDPENGSDSEETGKPGIGSKEKKHKRSHRLELASEDESDDSKIKDKKEAKRRRKEDKKTRKEERRRRREERRKRKKEHRAEKLKLKDQSDSSSSSDDAHVGRQGSHDSDKEKDRNEQKKLEIELRNKALELYKAKKGINH